MMLFTRNSCPVHDSILLVSMYEIGMHATPQYVGGQHAYHHPVIRSRAAVRFA